MTNTSGPQPDVQYCGPLVEDSGGSRAGCSAHFRPQRYLGEVAFDGLTHPFGNRG